MLPYDDDDDTSAVVRLMKRQQGVSLLKPAAVLTNDKLAVINEKLTVDLDHAGNS